MSKATLSNLSVAQLKKAVQIKEQITRLERDLAIVLNGSVSGNGARRGHGGNLSAAARARIAAAQRARWAKVRAKSSAND